MENLLSSFHNIDNGSRIQIGRNELHKKLNLLREQIIVVTAAIGASEENPQSAEIHDKHYKLSNFCLDLYTLIDTMPPGSRLLPGLINLHVSFQDENITLGILKKHQLPLPQANINKIELSEDAATLCASICGPDEQSPKCDFEALAPNEYDPKLQILTRLSEDILIKEEIIERASLI